MRLAWVVSISLAVLACTANNPNVVNPGDGGDDGGGGGDGGDDGGGAGDGGDDGGIPCTAPASCGPVMAGTGVCRAGIRYCLNGFLGPCTGEVNPSTESCNGADDDCNGASDDGLGMVSCGVGACKVTIAACGAAMAGRPSACVPNAAAAETCANGIDEDCDGVPDDGCACTYVAPVSLGGNDTTGTGLADAPFATIGKGIAMAGTNSLPMAVCVATDNSACGTARAATTYAENIVMRNGVSVYGGYEYDGNNSWNRVLGDLALQPAGWTQRTRCETIIAPTSDEGVKFDATVTMPTALDGFTVLGRSNASAATAAVTIAGSTGAVVNDNIIIGGASPSPVPMTTYGVNVDGTTGKATPLIVRNSIVGGRGATAIGVRVYKSAPVIDDHCAATGATAFDAAGRCQIWGCSSSCFGGTMAVRFIRGRPFDNNACNPTAMATGSTASYGVRLEDSPGAQVGRNAVCSGQSRGDAAGVRISGDATGTLVRANQAVAEGTTMGNVNAVGVWMDACAGAAPWLVDNRLIAGGSRTVGARGDGVRAVGDCHPRIDANVLIIGGEESAANDAYGVFCARDRASGAVSRCSITGNTAILGSAGGFPPLAAGVRCDTGGCARIERNTRISGFQGNNTYGVILDGTGAFVANNGIEAGCARVEGIGLLSTNSFARVENNVIGGSRWTTTNGGCNPGTMSATTSYAVRVVTGAGRNELELHSNDLFAFGTPTACTSRAIGFDIDTVAPPSAPRGVVRNNILHAGICNTSYDIDEMSKLAEPRILENNDLWVGPCGAVNGLPCAPSPSPSPAPLYRDEATTVLTTAAAVNALADITVAKNQSVDPGFMALSFAPMAASNMVPPGIHVDLGVGSMCIDQGTPTGAPTIDFYSGMRPVGSGFDVGADEGP